jgi:hypothetical protein
VAGTDAWSEGDLATGDPDSMIGAMDALPSIPRQSQE